jgi:hypothetical protein
MSRYILFCNKQHPKDVSVPEITYLQGDMTLGTHLYSTDFHPVIGL